MAVYLSACGLLICLGLLLNLQDRRMFLLTLVVGAGFYLPAPMESAERFYLFCISVEACVALVAMRVKDGEGGWVALVAFFLICSHIMGYVLDGSHPFSPYRLIVKALEALQIGLCVVLSPVVKTFLRNRHATTP